LSFGSAPSWARLSQQLYGGCYSSHDPQDQRGLDQEPGARPILRRRSDGIATMNRVALLEYFSGLLLIYRYIPRYHIYHRRIYIPSAQSVDLQVNRLTTDSSELRVVNTHVCSLSWIQKPSKSLILSTVD